MTPWRCGIVERTRHLLGDDERLFEAELLLATELLPQRLAAHEREHVVQKSVSRTGVDERQDVWVVEPSGDLDLGEEPLGAEDRPELGAEAP
jgi:hypothetical protein